MESRFSPKVVPLKSSTVFNVALLCSTFLVVGNCFPQAVAQEGRNASAAESQAEDNPVPQVRYRSRPVVAFHSSTKQSSTGSGNSSENAAPSPSGVPFIAVHELTSQTLEKLQENFRNVEAFLRNLRARKSQEDYIRSTSSTDGGPDTTRRTPYNNNVFTFKYHPVVLEGEGSSSVDDIVGGNSRAAPPRSYNGISFNPYPFDPKGEGSKNIDMERHTVATVYTIGICLTIMAIGSVMFILINKCDGSAGSSYMHSSSAYSAGNRITRSVIGAARRQSGNGRSRNGRSGGRSSGGSSENASGSANNSHNASGVAESVAKSQVDLPPSYDTLFPEGGPKVQEISSEQQSPISMTVIVNEPTTAVVNEQAGGGTDSRSQGGPNSNTAS